MFTHYFRQQLAETAKCLSSRTSYLITERHALQGDQAMRLPLEEIRGINWSRTSESTTSLGVLWLLTNNRTGRYPCVKARCVHTLKAPTLLLSPLFGTDDCVCICCKSGTHGALCGNIRSRAYQAKNTSPSEHRPTYSSIKLSVNLTELWHQPTKLFTFSRQKIKSKLSTIIGMQTHQAARTSQVTACLP